MNSAGAGSGSTASTAASGEASAGANTAGSGPVTAESLSDPDLGYTVVSIPEGLDATQTKVLQGFIAYDKLTWRIWSTGEGVENISEVATGTTRNDVVQNYAAREKGRLDRPPMRVAVTEVNVDQGGSAATVKACVDSTKVVTIDSSGKDVSNPEKQVRVLATEAMVLSPEGNWLASDEFTESNTSCSVD
ncbi:hypothetical protein [Actinomyces sp. ZJ308]|uniref:hypothetical protein n=1 Tax=Actinomyces sp. ZJ308 TaxID=2708342 RepID=UPI001FB93970|nr:hypothetical protein [Actinomyces sp. ZJ308]